YSPRPPGWTCRLSVESQTRANGESVAQHNVEQRFVDLERIAVFNKPCLSELVHEKTDARPCGAHHFSEHLLSELGKSRLGLAVLGDVRQPKQHTSQASLAEIEQLVDEILFKA